MVTIKTRAVSPPLTTWDKGGCAWPPSMLEMGDMGGGHTQSPSMLGLHGHC